MSQTTLTKFFNSRKRPATDDIVSSKNKIAHIERADSSSKLIKETSLPKQSDLLPRNVPTATITSNESEVTKKGEVQLAKNVNGVESEKSVDVFAKKANASNIIKGPESPKPTTVTVARKELSLGDIRKKLAGSSRLAELRATADRLSKGIQELKETNNKKVDESVKNLKEFKYIDVDVPISPIKQSTSRSEFLSPKKVDDGGLQQTPFISPRKVFVSPVKGPSKVPAYLKHSSSSSSSGLPLPHHYRFLAELFRGMETVVALMYNRNEKITFSKLKPSVQEMLKRNFTEKHLAQIKHLVPDFYNFEVQKNKNFSNTAHKESFELVISPNFPNNIKVMNPSVLLARRRYFYDTLLQLVKKHHARFCSTLEVPIEIPDDKIVRWHPEFELEKIPDIETAKLPELPNKEKYSSAQDVLAKARELFKCNTKMERALEKLAQAKTRGLTEQEKIATGVDEASKSANAATQTQPSTSGIQILNPALRNLPTALLEKVKAKQAAKALEAMTRSSEDDQKYMTYSRLPDLARTLRNIFVTERKNVLALNVVLSKLDSSFKSHVTANNLNKDIKLLAEEVPEFVKLHEIRNATYLKLDKNADLKRIIAKLEAVADKYKS